MSRLFFFMLRFLSLLLLVVAQRRDSSLSTESPPTNVEEGVEGGDPVETVVSPTAAARLAASGRSVSFVESPLDAQVVDSPVEEPLVETVVPSQSSLDDVSKVQPLADPPASSALRKVCVCVCV